MCTERKLAGSARSVLQDPAAEEEKDIPLEDFDLARAVCESSLRQWDVLQADALKLLASNPGSERAFRLAGMALARLGRWEEAEKLARERLARLPDDPVALESLTSTLLGKEDYRGVEKACLTLVAHGKATSMDYNNLAWNFLFTDGASEKAIEYAQQAVGPDERKNPMSLHTLATLYAELGKSAQARESLLESLEIRGLDEPEPHDWYVFGRIAESYGEIETAREDYGKVTRPEDAPLGGSTHLLAKARLARLGSAPPRPGASPVNSSAKGRPKPMQMHQARPFRSSP
jgi:tetratricopeptide (TPR) repeat protein